ncbi:alpha/beta hydrolase, partial [Acinetobacter baumannii]
PPVILENVGHMPILEAEQLVIQQYVPFLLKVETNQSSKTTTP